MLWDIGENRKLSQTSIVRFLAQALFDLGVSTTSIYVVLKNTKLFLQNLRYPRTKQKTENALNNPFIDLFFIWENVFISLISMHKNFTSNNKSVPILQYSPGGDITCGSAGGGQHYIHHRLINKEILTLTISLWEIGLTTSKLKDQSFFLVLVGCFMRWGCNSIKLDPGG